MRLWAKVTVSPRLMCQCGKLLAIGSHVSDKNTACLIFIRYQAVSGGHINVYIAIATHPMGHWRTMLPNSMSGPHGANPNVSSG